MAATDADPFDVAIAGAGIFGLAIARAAIEAGLKVVVLEKSHVGAGSSGGVLGALMPHMPARWNPKKEFQFQALLCLEERIRKLENQTGLSCGYHRCGRILPLTTTDKLEHHLERAEESKLRWRPLETGFSYVVEPAGSRSDWLDAGSAPFGIVYETLAARISPRAYLASLASFVRQNGSLREGVEVTGYDDATQTVLLADGLAPVKTRQFVISGGFAAFDLIEALTGERIGRGEKGQALVLEGKGLEERPAIYCDGLYVVPHDDGTVAIGSTSDREFEDAKPSPARSAELLQRATAFCPQLKRRRVLSDWAGIRPRNHRRDPLAGKLPGFETAFAATGGFKISFGIAHLIADALVAEMTGRDPAVPLPETFRPAHHFGSGRLDADR
ncbi:putative oxidoreductase, possibly D-amino acid oxidase protein [Stappia aggregata IAM 12614]|uniref:Putative oxidoreductase, possibly D-amino acid oxidase protein n=1 Tax=Roseibium aggregatum (strain ATCC 25650 / DSM 13394 / JCM 20685 / NBRC 16684 / NCIMB 2208 / IAM 12614 / B1) TaxID=384765 RepID=A0NLK9_ROSAI|nr:FAD-dependent oxidoreductase [Roseibium aggregatum]EAV45954.1 putative oxidoreductase, possibly D-amino acid oxidase protein [Stappia aggregata IAM 12614] [Roseibium aggregatum IAM 12614]